MLLLGDEVKCSLLGVDGKHKHLEGVLQLVDVSLCQLHSLLKFIEHPL